MATPHTKSVGISKELSEIVKESDNDMQDMQLKLAKLKSLTEEEKGENGMLRSRIEEQSQLIMILKQRSDEATLRIRALEKINSDLDGRQGEFNDERRRSKKKYDILDSRFNDLALNHEEMIKIKDEYKARNAGLVEENKHLREENSRLFSGAIAKKDETIKKQEDKISQLNNLYNTTVAKQKDTHAQQMSRIEELQRSESTRSNEIKENHRRINDLEERLKSSQAKLLNSEKNKDENRLENEKLLNKLTKEKDDLLELVLQRSKLLQERQSDVHRLELKVEFAERQLKEAQEKFQRDAIAVDSNLRVRKLKDELSSANKTHDELVREFEAFKKHTGGLLQKEKDLNAKLRLLVG